MHEPAQTTTTLHNIHKCCMKNLTIFNTQHVATRRKGVAKRSQHAVPNIVAKCCVEMLLSSRRGLLQAISGELPFCSYSSIRGDPKRRNDGTAEKPPNLKRWNRETAEQRKITPNPKRIRLLWSPVYQSFELGFVLVTNFTLRIFMNLVLLGTFYFFARLRTLR